MTSPCTVTYKCDIFAIGMCSVEIFTNIFETLEEAKEARCGNMDLFFPENTYSALVS